MWSRLEEEFDKVDILIFMYFLTPSLSWSLISYSLRLKITDVLEGLFCFYLCVVLENQERIYYFFPILPLFY